MADHSGLSAVDNKLSGPICQARYDVQTVCGADGVRAVAQVDSLGAADKAPVRTP